MDFSRTRRRSEEGKSLTESFSDGTTKLFSRGRRSSEEGKTLTESFSDGTSKFFTSMIAKKNGLFNDITSRIDSITKNPTSSGSENSSPASSPPPKTPPPRPRPPNIARLNSMKSRDGEGALTKKQEYRPVSKTASSSGYSETTATDEQYVVNGMNVSFDEPIYNKRENPIGRSGSDSDSKVPANKDQQNVDSVQQAQVVQSEQSQGGHSEQSQGGHSQQSRFGQSNQSQGGHSEQSQGGHSEHSQVGHSQQSQGGYSQQPQVGHSQQSQGGHSEQSQVGHSQQSQGGYSQQSQGGYSQQSQGGYSQQSQVGHSQESQGGHSQQSQGGHSENIKQNGFKKQPQDADERDNTTADGRTDKRAPKLQTNRRSSTVDELLFDDYVPPSDIGPDDDLVFQSDKPLPDNLISFDVTDDKHDDDSNDAPGRHAHSSDSSEDNDSTRNYYATASMDSSDAEFGGVQLQRSQSMGSDKSWSSAYSIDSQPDEVTLECMGFMKQFVDKIFNTE